MWVGFKRSSAFLEGVNGVELELDFLPEFTSRSQFRRPLTSFADDVAPFASQVTTFVTSLNASFQSHTVSRCTRRVTPGVTQGTTTKLQNGVIAEDFNQGRHVPHVDTPGSYGHHATHGSPVLGEVNTARLVLLNVVFAQQVNEAQSTGAIAFQLAHNGTGVDVVTPRHPQALSQNAEVDAVVLLPVDYRVHCPVNVQQHTVVATPVSQRRVSGKTTGQEVMHDDGHVELFRILGPLQHFFAGGSGHVQVVTFNLTSFCLGLVDGICYEQKAIAPALERLGVDVLVIFGEVKTAAQTFVNGPTIVLSGQAQLGLNGAAQQGTTVLVEAIALNLNPVGRTLEGLQVSYWNAQDPLTQGTQSFEAEIRYRPKKSTGW
jgi:hypothetical protein